MQAVEIQAVEAGLQLPAGAGRVVAGEPVDELQHRSVPPHPRREAVEVAERVEGRVIVARAAYETVDAVGIGPIGLDGHGGETLLLDQTSSDPCSLGIKLVRPVRGFPQQDEPGLADQVQQDVMVVRPARHGSCGPAHGEGQFLMRRRWHAIRPFLRISDLRSQPNLIPTLQTLCRSHPRQVRPSGNPGPATGAFGTQIAIRTRRDMPTFRPLTQEGRLWPPQLKRTRSPT